jgi:hypothetical protein
LANRGQSALVSVHVSESDDAAGYPFHSVSNTIKSGRGSSTTLPRAGKGQ